jgi:hypothetical protein
MGPRTDNPSGMTPLRTIFERLSERRPTLTADQAEEKLMKLGRFEDFSATGTATAMATRKVLALAKPDAKGQVTVDHFVAAVQRRYHFLPAALKLPEWSALDPSNAGRLTAKQLEPSLTRAAEMVADQLDWFPTALSHLVNEAAAARLVLALTDANHDQLLSKAEYDSLRDELNVIPPKET